MAAERSVLSLQLLVFSEMFPMTVRLFLTDQALFKFFVITHLLSLSHSPGPCVSLPPLPCSVPPVRESLISALVAVQMALCWCFTMGLRSVCLMPSTHSNFSTPAVSWLYLSLSKMILYQASLLLMCMWPYYGLKL